MFIWRSREKQWRHLKVARCAAMTISFPGKIREKRDTIFSAYTWPSAGPTRTTKIILFTEIRKRLKTNIKSNNTVDSTGRQSCLYYEITYFRMKYTAFVEGK